MNKAILLVDDERQILRSFAKIFLDLPYTILVAESGKEALRIINSETVSMVISDMRMPEMDGYALLREIKQKFPNIIRIILSGYADERVILKALQNNLAKLYLFKPWDNDEMIRILEHVFQAEEDLLKMDIFHAVLGLDDLPTKLSTYNRLTELIENDADIDALAGVIEGDIAISTRVLRIVNSAFYGAKTGSVKQAITFLGLINVRNIVLTSSIYESAATDPTTQKRLGLLSKHSTMTSRIMLIIYQEILKKKPSGDILSAGLLHDIGKLVTLNRFPDKFSLLFQNPDLMDVPWNDSMEMNLFGSTHTNIGAYLLNWWSLPYTLSEASRYHHQPENPNVMNKELVSVIHLADCLAWEMNGIPTKHGISPWALHQINTDIEVLRDLISSVESSIFEGIS